MTRARRPWGRATLWLVLLGPFFFVSYGLATYLATQRTQVPAIVFTWESAIPLIPWTIIPYWSIDILYGISLFLCATRAELDAHAKRLLTAQVLAVACFIAAPLRFTFERPALEGIPGQLFALLGEFDKPFNQAPSLHIALLVILWVRFAAHVRAPWVWALHAWFALIGASVLTTWQHHFIDVPTGAWLGFLALWLFPVCGPGPLAGAGLTRDPRRRRLALRYGGAGALLAAVALWRGGVALWLLWPVGSLLLVALIYGALGPDAFQKNAAGRLSLAVRWLLGPYLFGARINTRFWKGDGRVVAPLTQDVSLGRYPLRETAAQFDTIIDLSAELPGIPGREGYVSIPMLDLATPEPARLSAAVAAIEAARTCGPVLVNCALGYSRSAAAAASWLVASGHADSVEAAIAAIRAARPHIKLDAAAGAAIAAAVAPL
ncbi:phosphatase PAP2/dual specificity phosphatase family protein [Plastoroseomonas arctica]|uniref:Phosphatase PAP2/dual specificity phosphatase family protein n=1 Tax=Plastoroseomonas arctica TaxID=1509237 RepID=A0AAF1KL93_9PROT|nr:phosphatase PAP2/dual specificity phosphatase family protein [Plastoroseomonas arctica]MBR0655514.1 phosphatase PAP2/dual specificity phosphatase family protein [Plastoroseomonas arctica]